MGLEMLLEAHSAAHSTPQEFFHFQLWGSLVETQSEGNQFPAAFPPPPTALLKPTAMEMPERAGCKPISEPSTPFSFHFLAHSSFQRCYLPSSRLTQQVHGLLQAA